MMKIHIREVHPKATPPVPTRVSMPVIALHRPQRGAEDSSTEMIVTTKAILALVEAHPLATKTRTIHRRLAIYLTKEVAGGTEAVIAQAHPLMTTGPPTNLVHLPVQVSPRRPIPEITVTLVVTHRVVTTMVLGLHNVLVTHKSPLTITRALLVVDTAQGGNQVMELHLVLIHRGTVAIPHQLHME